MPEISRFYGIVILMRYGDHSPPHFHARYGGLEISVAIDPFEVLAGRLPPRARGMVFQWAQIHKDDLLRAWNRIEAAQPPGAIAPLD